MKRLYQAGKLYRLAILNYMITKSRHRLGRTEATIGIVCGVFLFLFFFGGAAYLLLVGSDRSDFQIVKGEIRTKQWRGSRLLGRRHVEFYTDMHHFYYGGLYQERIGSHLEPGMQITALVRPHEYRKGVLIVEELSVDGQLLITHEERRRHYLRFGYLALFLGLLSLGYILFCWRSIRTRK